MFNFLKNNLKQCMCKKHVLGQLCKFPQYTGKGKQMTCSCCNGSTSYVCLTCYKNADVTDQKSFVAVCSMACTVDGKKCHEREFKGEGQSEQSCEEWHQFASKHNVRGKPEGRGAFAKGREAAAAEAAEKKSK